MAEFVNKNITGVSVGDEIIKQMEAGKKGLELAFEFISELCKEVNEFHIYGMGDVKTTNKLIEFTNSL